MALSSYPKCVKLVEVGPRDGLQNEPLFVDTDQEVKSVKKLAQIRAKLYLMRGIQHTQKARRSSGTEADRLLQKAYKRYAAALEIDPQTHEALKHWGHALYYAAQNKSGKDQVKLYREACEKYAAAHEINPNDHETLSFWGLALSQQANSKRAENPDKLYRLAYEKFSGALMLNPNPHEALHHWGLALYHQARTKTGKEAEKLYQAACEKYSDALVINSKKPKVMNDWGVALMEQAGREATEASKALYEQVQEKFLAAEALQPGIASYNLACLHSLRGEYEECQKRLESARDNKTLPSLGHIQNDPDLANVRQLAWFKEFVKTIR